MEIWKINYLRKLRNLTAALAFGFFAQPSPAAELTLPDGAWVLAPVPKFLVTEEFRPIAGSATNGVVPALVKDGEPVPLGTAEFLALGWSWEDFVAGAQRNATTLLSALDVRFQRDKRRVVQSGDVISTNPLTACVLTAPGLAAKFEEILGPEFLVCAPNRDTLYFFPKLASPFQNFGGRVLSAYHNTAHPVSFELFQAKPGGLQVFGNYEQ